MHTLVINKNIYLICMTKSEDGMSQERRTRATRSVYSNSGLFGKLQIHKKMVVSINVI